MSNVRNDTKADGAAGKRKRMTCPGCGMPRDDSARLAYQREQQMAVVRQVESYQPGVIHPDAEGALLKALEEREHQVLEAVCTSLGIADDGPFTAGADWSSDLLGLIREKVKEREEEAVRFGARFGALPF